MTTLLFARHGQASFGKTDYDKLSPLGITQAKLLGQHYASIQRPIDAVITGSLTRQLDSAEHFLSAYNSDTADDDNDAKAKHLDASTIFDELNEFDHNDVFIKFNPDFTSKLGIMNAIAGAPVPKVRLAELFDEAMLRWHSGKFDTDYNESWTTFNDRVQQGLQRIIKRVREKDYDTVLIFTSGGVIAALAAGLLGLETDKGSNTAYTINRRLINTGVTSLIMKGDLPLLLSLNEHSHLYHQGNKHVTWY